MLLHRNVFEFKEKNNQTHIGVEARIRRAKASMRDTSGCTTSVGHW